jgi:hypothetical protein
MSFTLSKKKLFSYLDDVICNDIHSHHSTGIIYNEKVTPLMKEWCEDFNKKNPSFKVKITFKHTEDYRLAITFCGFKPTFTKEEPVEIEFDDYKKQVADYENTERHYNHDQDPQIVLDLFKPIKPKK